MSSSLILISSMWKLKPYLDGRQAWEFVGRDKDGMWKEAERLQSEFTASRLDQKHSSDAIYRLSRLGNVELDETPAVDTDDVARKAMRYYSVLQFESGHWPGDYGGPMFLLPGLIITCYITQHKLHEQQMVEIRRYLLNHQNEDGGWGLHVEGPSTIFGTALTYVTLRIIGGKKSEPELSKARKFLKDNGGAVGIPSWGKFWLCTLGVYDWAGMNPVPPETWLFPYILPVHPGRLWCHCRVVYLPMAYIYGCRHTCPERPLLAELREELYAQDYATIDWNAARNTVSDLDLYTPHSKVMDVVNALMYAYEKVRLPWLRKRATDECIDHIHHEDETTQYIDIGPVNKSMNMLSCWYEDPESEAFRRHADRVDDYMWLAEDGMKMQGYNGSQLWDTAFSVQAYHNTGQDADFAETMQRAWLYLEKTQVLVDVDNRHKYYRHQSKGAWPFSTRDHGWPISDCTAEGLKAALILRQKDYIDASLISDERLEWAVDMILSYQNPNGGWATYENTRGPAWLELFNPSEVFGDIMIDYCYVELTSACIQAMTAYRKQFPAYRSADIEASIQRAVKFIKGIQRADGSWYGSWGVCFTYGVWFGVEGLIDAGEPSDSPCVRNACAFLVSKQKEDGGWGETFESSASKEYVQNEKSQVVNTAWSLLALIKADYPDVEVIKRGMEFLRKSQLPNGDFPQQNISGVFNGNCMITYTNYRNIFPIWAVGRYARLME